MSNRNLLFHKIMRVFFTMKKQNIFFRIILFLGVAVNIYFAFQQFGNITWILSLVVLTFLLGYFERQIEIRKQIYPLSGEDAEYTLFESDRTPQPLKKTPQFIVDKEEAKEDSEDDEEESFDSESYKHSGKEFDEIVNEETDSGDNQDGDSDEVGKKKNEPSFLD